MILKYRSRNRDWRDIAPDRKRWRLDLTRRTVKAFGLLVTCVVAMLAPPLYAGTIGFENVPQTYWYQAGTQYLDNYYQGVTFGPQARILDDLYTTSDYPIYQGHAGLESGSSSMVIDLAVPAGYVSFWYTTYSTLTVNGYDAGNQLVATVSRVANLRTSTFLLLSPATSNIARVEILGPKNRYVIDELSADSISGQPWAVPLPAAVFLFGPGLLGLGLVKGRPGVKSKRRS